MKRVSKFASLFLLIILAGCADDVPDPITELPDLLPRIESLNVNEGSEIVGNSIIIVTFNKPMSTAVIEVDGVAGVTTLKDNSAIFTPSTKMPTGHHTLKVIATDEFGRGLDGFTPIGFNVIGTGTVQPGCPVLVYSNVRDGDIVSDDVVFGVEFDVSMSSITMEIPGVDGYTDFNSMDTYASFFPYSNIPSGSHNLIIYGADKNGKECQYTISFRVGSQVTGKGKIAFSSNRDGDYDIYLMNMDGSGVVPIVTSFGNDSQPVWSTDGSIIAFVSDRDGLWDGDYDIFLMNPDGTEQINITNSPGISEYSPFWSWDDEKIGFYVVGDLRLYLLEHDGANPRLMNENEQNSFRFLGQSLDRSKAAYASNSTGNWEIFLNIVGGKFGINLTNNFMDDFYPFYAADSKRIVFVSNRSDFNNEIYIMNDNGTNIIRLTNNPADDNTPSCSPF